MRRAPFAHTDNHKDSGLDEIVLSAVVGHQKELEPVKQPCTRITRSNAAMDTTTYQKDQEVQTRSSGIWSECDSSESSRLFLFESDLTSSLRRLPLAVRRKLDWCGVHLSLKGWQRMSRAIRTELLLLPVESAKERNHFATRLSALVRAIGCEDELSNQPGEADPEWLNMAKVPEAVQEELARVCPSVALDTFRWGGLSELERYALVKLSRPGHANRGFQLLVAEIFEGDEPGRMTELSNTTAA